MELIEHLEANLKTIASLIKLMLEGIAILCVLFGILASLKLAFNHFRKRRHNEYHKLRLKFGRWLALALECQLGADIVGTTIAPSFESLAQLAIVAVIRTFLNYFLNKELEKEIEIEKKSMIHDLHS